MALLMTWQHQNRRRRGSLPPLGLKNLGNTCYLNSVLQCLTFTPPLAQFCLQSQHSSLCKSLVMNREKECPFCILERQIARSLSLEGSLVDSPAKIQKCITLFAEHFRWGRQEDAHEFLRYVIDACHNTCLKIIKKKLTLSNGSSSNGNGATGPGPSTVMRDIFGGALLSQVKCLSCKGESNKTDEIMDISLDLFQTNSLEDALGRFFQPEVLDGNNKYNCSKCKKLSVAKKQMFILRAPNVLVIQLKRFEGIHGGKINRNIEFGEILELSKFMCSTSQDMQPEYTLFGSIVHSGFSPESGHYYAYIKDPLGRWYCCNDAHVSLSSTQEVLSEKVYILFYLRNSQSPRSTKTITACNSKTADSKGSEVSPKQKPAELPKPPTFKSNGAVPKNISPLKSGKISTNPQIKPFSLKNSEMKKVIANGNGNLKGHTNGFLAENEACKLSSSVKKSMPLHNGSLGKLKVENKAELSSSSKSSLVNGNSSNLAGNVRKPMLQAPNGNGYNNLHKIAMHVDNHTQILATVSRFDDCDSASNNIPTKNGSLTGAPKRKSCGIEREEALDLCSKGSSDFPSSDASCKTRASCHSEHSQELESFKELIASEASSDLRACGWVDKVHNFMRARKKICTEADGNGPDHTELRTQLIFEAKKNFLSQIPESLKEHLIKRLRSFSQGEPLFDG